MSNSGRLLWPLDAQTLATGLYRGELTVGLGPQPFIVGCGDDSLGARICGKNFCRMFAPRDIDRRRQPVGNHCTWGGDGYCGHLVGGLPGAWIENMMIAPCLLEW